LFCQITMQLVIKEHWGTCAMLKLSIICLIHLRDLQVMK